MDRNKQLTEKQKCFKLAHWQMQNNCKHLPVAFLQKYSIRSNWILILPHPHPQKTPKYPKAVLDLSSHLIIKVLVYTVMATSLIVKEKRIGTIQIFNVFCQGKICISLYPLFLV